MLLIELRRPVELTILDQELDRMFMPLGLDVRFSRHFQERILGRERSVTVQEVMDAFGMLKSKYKKRLLNAKKKGSYEAILKDFMHDLNVVFAIDGGNMDLITIKKKDPNQFFANKEGGDELKVGKRGVENEEAAEINDRLFYDNSKQNSPQAPPRNYTGGRNTHP